MLAGSGNLHPEGRKGKAKYLAEYIKWLNEIYEPLTWRECVEMDFWTTGFLRELGDISNKIRKAK